MMSPLSMYLLFGMGIKLTKRKPENDTTLYRRNADLHPDTADSDADCHDLEQP
jgi:hypothetical protein